MSKKDSSDQKVSRRVFFSAAGAVGATLSGVLPVEAAKAAPSRKWNIEADVIVVGVGAAGGCAAAKALDLGRSVILLEKAAIVGGTTAKSGGGLWIPNNSFMRAQGLDDPREDAIRLMARMSYPQLYDADAPTLGLVQLDYDLIAAFYDNGARAVDDLAKIGAMWTVQYTDSNGKPNFPDYSARLPENKAPLGRGLRPADPDDKGGPPNGQGGTGVNMISQLTSFIEKRGGRILTRHRVISLLVNGKGEVIGVEALDGTGKTIAVRAHRGVVFGSGGFTHNPEFADRFLKGHIFGGCAVPSNEGDFISIAGAAGAALGNLGNAWWAEVPVEQALQTRSTKTVIVPPGDSMFYVNKYGQRVVDEKMIYNERTQVHFIWDPDRYEFPNHILFMIWDQGTHDRFAGLFPIPPKGGAAPYVISAATLDDLADAIDDRLVQLRGKVAQVQLDSDFKKNLLETKKRFNRFARRHVDEDFHRGEFPASAWFHRRLYEGGAYDPSAPNDMLAPLADKGPYYATLLGAGTLDTKGGPRINARAQVLNAKGAPIPGLYGAGNCISSPAGSGYWAGGGTIGPALTFGYLAAENVADEPEKNAAI